MAATVSGNEPLTPADLQAAYGLTSASASDGYGQTVAVVDAFNDPQIQSDLAAYRSQFSLPACGSNSSHPQAGCLNVYNQAGTNLATDPSAAPHPSPTSDDWSGETSLDVDMVSAICPNCTIDLIEANDDTTTNLMSSDNTAVKLGAKFVSNSWGLNYFGGEYPGESQYDSYFNHPGVATVFASGDAGYGATYPASSQYVTSVGGTFLSQDSSGNWASTAWNDDGAGTGTVNSDFDGVLGAGGGGCAAGEPQPSWGPDASDNATGTLCANRVDADVSAVADAPYGVDSYDSAICDDVTTNNSFGTGNCDTYGTSAAAPMITAMYALAGTPTANTYPASYLYKDPSGLTPVTSGTDTLPTAYSPLTCESNRQYLCNAADSLTTPYNGYNGPTGLGTPNGNLASFKNNAAGHVVSLPNPGPYNVQQGASVTLPALKAIDSASGQTITYSASGLPAGLSLNSSTGVISGKVTSVENGTVKVTAKDTTGASATVVFRIAATPSLTASYHAGTGLVELNIDDKCLNDYGNSSTNGTKVAIWTCESGAASETWSFQPSSAPGVIGNDVSKNGMSQLGTVRIHGKCLDIKSNGTANGSLADLYTCSGGANQLWEIMGPSGQGKTGDLYNPQSGKCLDDPGLSTTNGKQLDIWTCNGGDNEEWFLPGSPFDSGLAGKCMAVAGNSTANGATVESYTCNGASYEKVQSETVVGGEFVVLGMNGKCLDAKGNTTVNGTPVVLWTCVNSSTGYIYPNNLWMYTAYGQIENVQAQKCLAVPGNSASNSVGLQLQDCYGEPGEVWAAS